MAILIPNYNLAKIIGSQVSIEASTVAEFISLGIERFGEPFRNAIKSSAIVVNGRNIGRLQGAKTPLGPEDKIWLLTPSGGG